jgi:hypothetical protein
MTDSYAEITDIIVDCSDPERLAAFWCDLLARFPEGRRTQAMQKQGPHRHLRSGHREIKDHVEALGGRSLDGYEDGGFLVIADPEGNEFCVVPEDLSFDASGRADYLDRLNLGGS